MMKEVVRTMTITTEKAAKECLRDSDLPIAYSYRGLGGEKLWAFFTDPHYDDMHSSPFVQSPVVLKYDDTLTEDGFKFEEEE